MAITIGTNAGFVTVSPVDDPAGTDYGRDNYGIVMIDTVPASARRVTEVGFWVDNATEEANWRMALYDDNGATVPGEAGTRLFLSSDVAKGTTGGWKKTAVDWDITAYQGTSLWIAIGLDDTVTTTNMNYTSTGGPGIDTRSGASALPDPFGGGAIGATIAKIAIYALVSSEAGGGTPVNASIGEELMWE